MKTLFLTFLGFLPTFCLLGYGKYSSGNISATDLTFGINAFPDQMPFTNHNFISYRQGTNYQTDFQLDVNLLNSNPMISKSKFSNSSYSSSFLRLNHQNTSLDTVKVELFTQNNQNITLDRRLKYSGLWAYTSLNYIYADLMGLMDVNLLTQYQTGIVDGVEITPEFLALAAAYMQIPLANVFLPYIIKSDRALRWVQIVSGSIATLVQAGSLFVGKPTPYYILFSAIEIGATAYIAIDAIKWKPSKKSKIVR
ncbi:MAG: DUF6326 family protein [Bacteroidota bacterium]